MAWNRELFWTVNLSTMWNQVRVPQTHKKCFICRQSQAVFCVHCNRAGVCGIAVSHTPPAQSTALSAQYALLHTSVEEHDEHAHIDINADQAHDSELHCQCLAQKVLTSNF